MAAKYSLRDHIDALNRHDADAFAAFYAPDVLADDPQYPEPLRGRDAIRKDIIDFWQAFPDIHFTLKNSLESGDAVAFEGLASGTHMGSMLGPEGEIPATNRPVRFRFAAFLRLDNQGLIAEERRYFDMAGMMQQLGLAP
jgi:steroid delta-isomerase-like uncharacterized protein